MLSWIFIGDYGFLFLCLKINKAWFFIHCANFWNHYNFLNIKNKSINLLFLETKVERSIKVENILEKRIFKFGICEF